MPNDVGGVWISVGVADDAGQRELLAATRTLVEELSSVGRVESVSSAAPSGAKGLDALDPGSFILTGALTASLLRALVRVVTTFINRRSAETVMMEVDGDIVVIKGGVSGSAQRALVEAWIERRALAHDIVDRVAGDGTSRIDDEG
jgi:hypothetical protein